MSSSHGRQSTTSRAPEVNPPGALLTIGELARRTGVSTSALRYNAGITARLAGQPLSRSHQQLHGE